MRGKKILLLQGPVGPFFKDLEIELQRVGCDVRRVGFSPADFLFSGRCQASFRGGLGDWHEELRKTIAEWRPDMVVLFGSSRPPHVVARDICQPMGIPVLALEEGYIRPGYVTAEWGGNNADSPMAGKVPKSEIGTKLPEATDFDSLRYLKLHAGIYYTIRTLFAGRFQRSLFHRPIHLWSEATGWGRSVWKGLTRERAERPLIVGLMSRGAPPFYLVPLQVPTDANLQGAACGWTNRRLVDATLASFARTAPQEARLVFKIHPMARGHGNMEDQIRSVAMGNGVSDRVDILQSGSLGGLTRGCSGMITINSTSGLSALAHGCPLLVVGKSVYASPALATCANGVPDFDKFWSGGFVSSEAVRKNFLAWVGEQALVPGDFYAPTGRVIAARGIQRKISKRLSAQKSEFPQGEHFPEEERRPKYSA